MTLTDEVILSRVAAGETEALGELYRRYGGVVLGVVHRILGDHGQAHTATAIAFHTVRQRAARYRPELGSARSWLVMTARSSLIDRRALGGRVVPVVRSAKATSLFGAVADSGEDGLTVTSRTERLRAAAKTLPAEQQAVLALALWSGCSQTEIAKATDLPVETVKTRLCLAMTTLKDALRAEQDPPPVR